MKSGRILAIGLLAVSAISGPSLAKKAPEMSALQLQQMQSRDVEASKAVAFSAVMSVLQDSGYRIGSADKDTGLITGTASTSSKLTWAPFVGFGRGKKTPVVSAYLEERGNSVTSIRLNFVMGKSVTNQFGSNADEEPILDPAVYQDAFEKIEQAIFIRQATNSPAPAQPVAAAATTSANGTSSAAPAAQ